MNRPDDDAGDFDPNAVLREFNRKLHTRDEPLDLDSLLGDLGPPGATGADGAAAAAPPGAAGRRRQRAAFGDDEIVDIPHVDLPPPAAPVASDDASLLIDLPPPDLSPPPGVPEVDMPVIEDVAPPDVEAIESIVGQVSRHAADVFEAPGRDSDWTPEPTLRLQTEADPRLLAQWAPGAWTAALRRAHGAANEVRQGDRGPMVESFAPQSLLALWPPQGADQPLLQRWPQCVKLIEAEADDVAAAALALIPPQSSLWLNTDDVDWALIAEIALHHESGLRDFQIEALRALAQTEREAAFARINDTYAQPGAGQPVRRKSTD